MGVEIEGTELLLSDLEKLIPTDMDVGEALMAGGEIVADGMRGFAPVGETGDLKAAIKAGRVRRGKRGQTLTVGVHRRDIDLSKADGHYYPAYVNYGHGGPRPAPPHPFIQPGYDVTQDAAYDAIKRVTTQQYKEKGI